MQLALPLTLPSGRPLVPLEACFVLLDRDEDEVLGEVETGKLGWAFDLRTRGAVRREVRVWRESLLERLAGLQPQTSGSTLAVVDTFLPHRDIRLMELARWFSCSGSHITNLVRDGSLELAGDRPCHSSVAAVTRICRASVVSFLSCRRIL